MWSCRLVARRRRVVGIWYGYSFASSGNDRIVGWMLGKQVTCSLEGGGTGVTVLWGTKQVIDP
jgi:hypothetical protein